MPSGVESFTLCYRYERFAEVVLKTTSGQLTTRQEQNIIDLGLIAADGTQVGASGSDKTKIFVSEISATPGYRPRPMTEGKWRILLGAYKVSSQGVSVHYELAFTYKAKRWLKGDLHTHTLGSDGVLSVEELARHAARHRLDFLAITDHNQMISTIELPTIPGITLIPGVEWTHYLGHANFLGVDRPYDGPFHANGLDQIHLRFASARERGALIVLNHPFEEVCPFKLDINTIPFDCLEVWNGPMREANFRTVGLWQNLLVAGKRVPICGGSDYHRSQLFLFPGGPTTVVSCMSASPADILQALRLGHAYVIFSPDGPTLEMTSGAVMMGDSAVFSEHQEVHISADNLKKGDVLQVVTADGNQPLTQVESDASFDGAVAVDKPGFVRVEVWREFLPGIPRLPALLSNPIYFEMVD